MNVNGSQFKKLVESLKRDMKGAIICTNDGEREEVPAKKIDYQPGDDCCKVTNKEGVVVWIDVGSITKIIFDK